MLAAPPVVPECIEGFVHRLRFVEAVKRIGYEPRTNSEFTLIEAGALDPQASSEVFEAEEQCLKQWPEDLPLVRFQLVNLGDLPEEQRPQLLQKYRGAIPLLV